MCFLQNIERLSMSQKVLVLILYANERPQAGPAGKSLCQGASERGNDVREIRSAYRRP